MPMFHNKAQQPINLVSVVAISSRAGDHSTKDADKGIIRRSKNEYKSVMNVQ